MTSSMRTSSLGLPSPAMQVGRYPIGRTRQGPRRYRYGPVGRAAHTDLTRKSDKKIGLLVGSLKRLVYNLHLMVACSRRAGHHGREGPAVRILAGTGFF